MRFSSRRSSSGWLCAPFVGRLSLVVSLFAMAGCAGQPVPLWAIAGTTMGLAISPEDPTLHGGTMAYGTASIPDPQRGALGVEFRRNSTGVLMQTVPVKLVTRIMPDPASPAGLAGELSLPESPLQPTTEAIHQVIALIDIPASLPEDGYRLTIRRYRDGTLATLVDEGPGESPLWDNELYVSAGDGSSYSTPFQGGWGSGAFSSMRNIPPSFLREVIPNPQLLLTLPVSTAAATLEIAFPAAKVDIAGAIVHQRVGQGSMVTLESVDSNRVRIHYVNPAADAGALALVFENTQSGYQPVLPSEFSYEAGAFYDDNGDPLSPGSGYNPIGQIR